MSTWPLGGLEPGRWYDQMPGPGSFLLLVELIRGPQANLEWLQPGLLEIL